VRLIDRIYIKVLAWRRRYLRDYTFVLLLAVLVGVVAGLASVLLKTIINTVEIYTTTLTSKGFFLFVPLLGILLVSALKRFFFQKVSTFSGIGSIIYSIARTNARIPGMLMYTRMITSGLTMGFGGSAGLEAPAVVTGSAIGSNLASFFNLGHKFRTLFIGCGSAAGLAAIFNAPVAGTLFALEVLIPHFSTEIFIPVLISAASGSLFSQLFMDGEVLFQISEVSVFKANEVPLVVLLGLLSGVTSIYYTKVGGWVQNQLKQMESWYLRAIVGGLLLGGLLYAFPLFYGEGYLSVRFLLDHEVNGLYESSLFSFLPGTALFLSIFMTALVLLKPIAASLTLGGGGDGGMFAPSFITGAYLGFLFYTLVILAFPSWQINPTNFILLGMSGVLAGVMHSPLTAIFLIAEMSGGYTLFIPLMIIVACAYFMKLYFHQKPIYLQSKLLEDINFEHQEAISLHQMEMQDLLETDLRQINPETNLGDLVKIIASSRRNIFPVVQAGQLMGVLLLDDIRPIMFDTSRYQELKVKDMMVLPPTTIEWNEPMSSVLSKFEKTGAWNLPVLDQGKYKGFISKSNILSEYREALRKSRDID